MRKIIDLIDLEGHEVQDENKFFYDKYGVGVDVQSKFLSYENELENKKRNLESEVEALRRISDEKYNNLVNGKNCLLAEKENVINEVQNKLENNMKENYYYNAKIHMLEQDLLNNIEILKKEKKEYDEIKKNNMVYDDSIASSNKLLEENILIIEKNKNEVVSIKKDILDNSLNYHELKSKVEFLLKKLSNINRNNLSLTEFIEKTINNISEKKEVIVKRDEKLDSAIYYKNKVIQTLKELSTVKKYLTIEKKAEKDEDVELK